MSEKILIEYDKDVGVLISRFSRCDGLSLYAITDLIEHLQCIIDELKDMKRYTEWILEK